MAIVNSVQSVINQAPTGLAGVGQLGMNKPVEIKYMIAQVDGIKPGRAVKLGTEQGSVVPVTSASDAVFGVVLDNNFEEFHPDGYVALEDGTVAVLKQGYVVVDAVATGFAEGGAGKIDANGKFDNGGTAVTGITVSRVADGKVEMRVHL